MFQQYLFQQIRADTLERPGNEINRSVFQPP